MFGKVTNDVLRATNRSQEPRSYGPGIAERIVLNPTMAGLVQDQGKQPDSVAPLSKVQKLYDPADILVAMTDVNLRTGPRKWDATQKDYANATTVKRQGQADKGQLIKQGQRVKVGGDIVLATGGLSIWAPISKILSTSE